MKRVPTAWLAIVAIVSWRNVQRIGGRGGVRPPRRGGWASRPIGSRRRRRKSARRRWRGWRRPSRTRPFALGGGVLAGFPKTPRRTVARLPGGDDRLGRSPAAARLLELCSKPPSSPSLPDQAWLFDPKLPPLVGANLRLVYGRWLVQASLIEEALDQLSGPAARRRGGPGGTALLSGGGLSSNAQPGRRASRARTSCSTAPRRAPAATWPSPA